MAKTQQYFNRDVVLTLGTRLIRARPEVPESTAEGQRQKQVARPTLRIQFQVDRSLDLSTNTCRVSITNLGQDSRAAIAANQLQCVIEAGYVNALGQIFSGQLNFANHQRSGPDWISSFEAADGGFAARSARTNESWTKGTEIKAVLQQLVSCSGLDAGNIFTEIEKGNPKPISQFLNGFSTNGRCLDEISKIAKDLLGYDSVSVQDNKLQVLRRNQTLNDRAVVLEPGTGLIGSPELGEEGTVRAISLLNPRLKPGSKVQISSQHIDKGFFKIERVNHNGDTGSNTWYSTIECKRAR